MVQLFAGHQLAMFLVPCAIGGFFVTLFAATLDDRRLPAHGEPDVGDHAEGGSARTLETLLLGDCGLHGLRARIAERHAPRHVAGRDFIQLLGQRGQLLVVEIRA